MTEEQKAALEVWRVTIDVQKHFNDLSMRVRNFAITVLGALLAAAGYALKDGTTVTLLNRSFSVTAWILSAALICWFAFYFMDLHWYHRLLRGAVKHGKQVELGLESQIPNIGLTHTIAAASPVYGLSALQRLAIFYGLIGSVLVVGVLAAFHAKAWQCVVSGALLLLAAGLTVLRPRTRGRENPATVSDTAKVTGHSGSNGLES